jgi:hypothetical protein
MTSQQLRLVDYTAGTDADWREVSPNELSHPRLDLVANNVGVVRELLKFLRRFQLCRESGVPIA